MKILSIYGISKDYFNKNEKEEIKKFPNGELLNLEYPKLLDEFFNQLSLYQDSYKTTKNCILLLKKFTHLIDFPLEEGSNEYKSYIFEKLNECSGEVKKYFILKLL